MIVIIKVSVVCMIILYILGCSNKSDKQMNLQFISSQKLDNYPSGSTITWHNGQFYLMGDDASDLLALDALLQITNRINLFESNEFRIAKAIKADIEASAWINQKLVLFSSGSLSPYRDSAFRYDPEDDKITRLDLMHFTTVYAAKFRV